MKFSGKLGYAITEETKPGVWSDGIVERSTTGDVINSGYRFEHPGDVNLDLNLDLRISIVMDAFIKQNFGSIKYVKFEGINWAVKSVTVQYPRLILTLGGEYNG